MLKIYHTPGSRSVRPIWLCFELDIPAQIKRVDASYRGTPEWRAISPTGKVPAIEDGYTTICESGAILDYLLARYGEGRLQPAIGSPQCAEYRQWFWFAEETLIRPVGLYRLLRVFGLACLRLSVELNAIEAFEVSILRPQQGSVFLRRGINNAVGQR